MTRKLHNYLRAHRKGAGFSQREVAFLLGCETGSAVSRYERFRREPTARVVFALEVLFGASAKNLFAGLYERIAEETLSRAEKLQQKLRTMPTARSHERKLRLLELAIEGKRAATTE